MICGDRTKIYRSELSNLHHRAICGEDCIVHSHVWIGEGVEIGDRCKIEAFAFIPSGVSIGDDVFIGPHVCFTNDKHPPSGGRNWATTLVSDGVVIGAGAIILPGLTLGQGCVIGAGAVVTKNVSGGVTVIGNPARNFDAIHSKR